MEGASGPFRTILVGAALSPYTAGLLRRASALAHRWGARVVVVHAAPRPAVDAEQRLRDVLGDSPAEIEVRSAKDPAVALLDVARAAGADLVLTGALEKEPVVRRLFGSVARHLARVAPCSVLLLPTSIDTEPRFDTIVVGLDASDEAELALSTAARVARREEDGRLVAVWQYEVPGLAMALGGSGSASDTERARARVHADEEARLAAVLKTVDLADVPVEALCRYGEPGWLVNDIAHEHRADLLVVPAPAGRDGIFRRLYGDEADFVLRRLSCAVLFVRFPHGERA